MPVRPHVLLVEDDDIIRRALVIALEHEGYEVQAEVDGTRFAEILAQFQPDLVILDVRLPAGPDGYSLARSLRETSDTPVIFLTAADTEQERLSGFEAGGDDYLVKPFFVGELLARMGALLRRSGKLHPTVLRSGDVILDEAAGTAARAGHPLDLSPIEFLLLAVLLRNRGQLMSKAKLLDLLWGDAYDPNLVEVQIYSLRRKLEAHGPRLIHTVSKMGYRIDP